MTVPSGGRSRGPSRGPSGGRSGGPSGGPSPRGRRAAAAADRTSPPLSLILAGLLPLVVLAAALLVNGEPTAPAAPTAASEAPLTSLHLPCPPASAGAIGLGTLQPDVSGGVSLTVGQEHRAAKVTAHRVTWVNEPHAAVVVGREGMAPGLVASRVDERRAAAVGCHEPRPETWFTGVGAASIHSSILRLVNPDTGPAVAEVTIYSQRGLLDVPRLRGLTVPGGTVVSIDLSKEAPVTGDLAIRVAVARGRLGASLLDSFTERTRTADWISAQYAPSLANTVVGVATGSGPRTLVVANPSDSEARVQVRVIGSRSTFVPEGFEELSVPPQSVIVKNVAKFIGAAAAKDTVGLLVTSTQPVTVAVRSLVDGELSSAVAVDAFSHVGLVVPPGKAALQIAAPDLAGAAQVTAYSAAGKVLLDTRIAAKKLTGATLALPEGTAYVLVDADAPTLHGAVRVTSARGVVTLPLFDAVMTRLIPDVQARLH